MSDVIICGFGFVFDPYRFSPLEAVQDNYIDREEDFPFWALFVNAVKNSKEWAPVTDERGWTTDVFSKVVLEVAQARVKR
jgi:hypothetical protein